MEGVPIILWTGGELIKIAQSKKKNQERSSVGKQHSSSAAPVVVTIVMFMHRRLTFSEHKGKTAELAIVPLEKRSALLIAL